MAPTDRLKILTLHLAGNSVASIAREFGVTEKVVEQIVSGSVAPEPPPAPKSRRAVDPRLAAEHMRIRAPKRQNNALTNLAFGSAPHSDDPCLALHLAAGGKVVNRG